MHKHFVLAVLLAVATQDALAKESRNSIGAELADDNRAGAQNDFTADVIKTMLAPIDADLDADLDAEFKSQSNEGQEMMLDAKRRRRRSHRHHSHNPHRHHPHRHHRHTPTCPSECNGKPDNENHKCHPGGTFKEWENKKYFIPNDNGGINLNATGYCTQTCSKEYDRRRFCGVGSEYTGPDSVDCTGCATAKTMPKPCPSVCKCLSGDTTNGGIDVNAHGYCTQTCSKIYPNWHKQDPLARFCGVGSEYTGTGSVDCTGCADAHSAWYADTLCLPGGINSKDPYNPEDQRACAHLSEKKCVASPNCTFHSSCETSVPLSALAGHQNLFRQFPDFEGQSFTCSCDEALQFYQIQKFLFELGVKGDTNSCRAKGKYSHLPGVRTWCQKLKTNEACMASSATCEDPHFAGQGAFAKTQVATFIDALKGCADQKCEACNAKSSGAEEDMQQTATVGNRCLGGDSYGGRRLR